MKIVKMRYSAKTEQKRFWQIFDKKLTEKGEPFIILHEKSGEITFWGTINKKRSFVNNCVCVEFLTRESILRLNIYIRNDISLFSFLERHKQEINSMISVPVQWVNGNKNPNTRRIMYVLPISIGNNDNYENVIDEALPIIMDFIDVCRKYANDEFFDI